MAAHGPGERRPLTSRACPTTHEHDSDTGTGLGLLLALVCARRAAHRPPGRRPGGRRRRARLVRVTSWAADARLTGEFARYGDDASRADDWTGGDGTHSVRLPDGRVLWLFSDTYLGQVYAPPNPVGESYAWRDTTAPLVRNSAVVMGRRPPADARSPRPLFPDPAPQQWRWPVAARVEPRSPGSVRAGRPRPAVDPYDGPGPLDLRRAHRHRGRHALAARPAARRHHARSSTSSAVADPARRVLFGTTGGRRGRLDVRLRRRRRRRPPPSRASKAYVARVPRGRLGGSGRVAVLGRRARGRCGPRRAGARGRAAHGGGQRVHGGARRRARTSCSRWPPAPRA